jgi:hypothetical protein
MQLLKWDQEGERVFETGVSHGVLFPKNPNYQPGGEGTYYQKGVAWNGLTSVTQSPSGAEASAVYADNIKYLNLMSNEEFAGTIEAYTYPDEFAACDGSASLSNGAIKFGQQKRLPFAFSYQTKVGNDQDPEAGYKIHIIYGATAAPSERAYETVNDSPEAITFSWEISTVPVEVTGHKPTAHIEIDSTKADATKLALVESALYGTDVEADITTIAAVVTGFTGQPTLLMPDQIIALLS